MNINGIIRNYLPPLIYIRSYLIKNTRLGKLYLKNKTSKAFYNRFNRVLNWQHPVDLNEKIQWLKYNSDISLWTKCSDKYKVREYVNDCGLNNILIPLYGVWDDPKDINFDNLPSSFVLKTNNSSGTNIIVKDKSTIDEEEIRQLLNQWLKERKWKVSLELQYFKIKPKIIAEEYLSSAGQDIPSFSLVDYKVWCFNGEPYSIWTCYDRDKHSTYVALYDLDWNYRPEHSVFTDHYRRGKLKIPKPKVFDEMMSASRKLSNGIPQVRLDFYVVHDKLYFGEMTFTSLGGSMDFFTRNYLIEMGRKVKLPKKLTAS